MSTPHVQTFTPVIGSLACNANCPYCCSKMTCTYGLTEKEPDYHWTNFHIAAQISRERGCVTAFITSKGEPTLFPETVTTVIVNLKKTHKFPLIELQTNGITLEKLNEQKLLKQWNLLGLNTICISTVHWNDDKNQEIYGPQYTNLRDAIRICAENGIKVRISCVMLKGFVETYQDVQVFRNLLTSWGQYVQFVIRPVSAPVKCCAPKEKWRLTWIKENSPDSRKLREIHDWLEWQCKAKRVLAHGATVYSMLMEEDKPEANICLSNCFTPPTDDKEIRQIIWLPNGTITDNWDHEGLDIL